VSDLARLSLADPEYVAVHSEAPAATPHRLKQAYVTCELHQKMDLLWFFLKTHQKQKTIVFLSTCKQVGGEGSGRGAGRRERRAIEVSPLLAPLRAPLLLPHLLPRRCRAADWWAAQVKFAHEAFRKLRPGVPVKMLHGHMKQMRRLAVFYNFNEAQAMVLFATDIAARGLDFPRVDWVVQADCPEDVQGYIHRVGRTARFRSGASAAASAGCSPALSRGAAAQRSACYGSYCALA